MEIKKTARVGVLLSCLPVTSGQLLVKSPLASLIMLFRLPISSTTYFPILSHLKQSEMHSRKTIFTPLSSRNVLCSKRFIDWTVLNLPSTMKIEYITLPHLFRSDSGYSDRNFRNFQNPVDFFLYVVSPV